MLIFLIFSNIFFQLQKPVQQEEGLQDSATSISNSDYSTLLETVYLDDVPVLSVEELKKLKREDLVLLDTRAEKEFTVSHLKRAREVGYFWFDMRSLYDIPKDAYIVLYCAVGNRSTKIAEKLIKSGYKNVYVLYGGIFEWVNTGNPVYTKKDVQTSQVHGYTKEWSKWLKKENRVL